MKILKYIINEKKIPIIFNTEIMHSDVMLNAISAGFLILRFDTQHGKFLATCYGESSSLKINKSIEDETLIEHFLNNQFYSKKIER